MTHSSPGSVIVDRIRRAFPSGELRERARTTDLAQRERKFGIVALLYTLLFSFTAGPNRSLRAFLERYVKMVGYDEFSYVSFHGWLEPGFIVLLREILDDAIENLDVGREDLNSRSEHFRDVLIADATIVSLYQDAADIYTTAGDHQAKLKLHLTESFLTGLPTRFRITDGTIHERSQLPTGE